MCIRDRDCTVRNERHRTRLACRRPGAGTHKDIKRGKVPSAARVACIARSACTSLDQNSNKQIFSQQSGTMGRTLGYIYTSIYYSCKSFPVLLHDVMVGWWIASWVPMLYYVLLYCCSTAALLLYRVVSELIGSFLSCVAVVCTHGFVGLSFSFSPAIPAPRWHNKACR